MKRHFDSNILSAIFVRNGKRGIYTDLFYDLLPEKQQVLLKAISLKEDEQLVVACVKQVDNWFLLTTNRVIWNTAGKSQEIDLHDISQVAIDRQALLRGKGKITQLQLEHLIVTTMDKTEYIIELEAGEPLGGIRSILHWIAMRNIKKRNA